MAILVSFMHYFKNEMKSTPSIAEAKLPRSGRLVMELVFLLFESSTAPETFHLANSKALTTASMVGTVEMVDFLLGFGADNAIANNNGVIPQRAHEGGRIAARQRC